MSIIKQTKDYVKKELYNDASGHDWWHIFRVWKNSKLISAHYTQADRKVIELAALLHDIADWKDNGGDFDIGPATARKWLVQFDDINSEQIDQVCDIIKNVSFKGANAEQVALPLEGLIVQDADRLDAIGALGIARTFAFGGNRGHMIYDPNIQYVDHKDEESYVHNKKQTTTINHFYEKLLLLKDRFNTEYGKRIAEERHKYMESFLEQFYGEWNGER